MNVTVSSVPEVLALVLNVLAAEPAGLLADFDGTMSPIAPVPEAAYLHPDLVRILPTLVTQVPLFGIITGRSVADARQKIGLDDVLLVGNHGLEWSENGTYRAHPAGVAAEQAIIDALEAIEQDLKALDRDLTGLVFENKRLSASIHFRLVKDPDTFEIAIAPITAQRAEEFGLRMTTGKMMVELRPLASVSKGSALAEVVATHGLRGAVFLGDDVTDVDAFRAIKRLRADGTLTAGLAIGVMSDDTNPMIVEEGDVLLNDVNDVAALLDALSETLSATQE